LLVSFVVATLVYFACGSPLHRLASNAFSRKRVDLYAGISLVSSILYWFSTVAAVGWLFFPRYFPLRWLKPDLTIQNYFAETCAFVAFGIVLIHRFRDRRSGVHLEIARGLSEKGFVVIEDFLPSELCAEARAEILRAREEGRIQPASVGKVSTDGRKLHPEIRRDGTLWFEPGQLTRIQSAIWKKLEDLRQELNHALFLGLWDFEGHYAVYEPGAFYRKHLDRFRDDSRRTVSVVLFFNSNWRSEDGGELALELPEGQRKVLPREGTAVFFLSDQVPHEVRETRRERMSFAGWYRTRSGSGSS